MAVQQPDVRCARRLSLLGISLAEPGEDDGDCRALDRLFLDCWEDDAGSAASGGSEDPAVAPGGSWGGPRLQIAVQRIAWHRSEIAKFCFRDDPYIARRALGHLIRLLESSPLGHPDVAFGLLRLTHFFIESVPIRIFEALPLDMSVRVIRCMFLLVECVRAEHLIGNFPAISQETRDEIWDFADGICALNVRSAEGIQGLLDESADLLAELWLDALIQSAQRLKTPVSKGAEAAAAAAGAAGAALKLYKGDVAAGLSQLRSAFCRSTVLTAANTWFEDVTMLRKLAADAVANELVFRQLKWVVASGSLSGVAMFELAQKPRFHMHVIICLDRLVVEGATEFIREQSFQLLVSYAINDSVYLQYIAAKVLERLSEDGSGVQEKVRSTASVVLVVLERTFLSKSKVSVLRNYSVRLRKKWEMGKLGRRRTDFEGYTSVIQSLISNLNEGDLGTSEADDGGGTLMHAASGVTSHHAERIIEALRQEVYFGYDVVEPFEQVDKVSGLTPVHCASKSGVRGNLEWMLTTAQQTDPELAKHLATLETAMDRKKPIHMAGSVEILCLLLDYRAELDVKDDNGNSILHTLTSAGALEYLLLGEGRERLAGLTQQIDVNLQNDDGFPALFMPRSAEVVRVLLQAQANVNEEAGQNKVTALHVAAQEDEPGTCRALIAANADIFHKSSWGQTVLFGAGINTFPCLLPQGRESPLARAVNEVDKYGSTALFAAKTVLVARELIKLRAQVNVVNKLKQQPLFMAIENSSGTCLVRYLVEQRADVRAKNSIGDPIFMEVVMMGNINLALSLLKNCAMRRELLQQVSDADGMSIVNFCDTAMLNVLLPVAREEGLNLLEDRNKMDGQTMWHYTRNAHMADYLQRQGLSQMGVLNRERHDTILFMDFAMDPEELKLLLERRADPGAVDASGKTVLACHIEGSPAPLRSVRILLEAKANPLAGSYPHVLAWTASDSTYPGDGLLKLLLQRRCEVNAATRQMANPALHTAVDAWSQAPEGVKRTTKLDALVLAKADVAAVNAFGRTALHVAATSGLPVVKKVLALHPANAQVADLSGETPEELARRLGLEEAAQYISRNGENWGGGARARAYISRSGKQGGGGAWTRAALFGKEERDPFLLARLGRAQDAIRELQVMGGPGKWGRPNQKFDGEWGRLDPITGGTILHSAISGGSLDLVKFVLSQAPGLATARGVEPLRRPPLEHLAECRMQPQDATGMAEALVSARADPLEITEGFKKAPLTFRAASSGNHAVLRFLLQRKVEPDALDNQSQRALIHCKDGRSAAVLFEFGAGLVAPEGCVDTETVLHKRSSILCAALGVRGADAYVNSTNASGQTPLHCAKTARATRALLERKADVHMQDDDGRTPLHCLVGSVGEDDGPEAVRLLLQAKASVNSQDVNGASPLFHVQMAPVANLLIFAQADVQQTSKQGKLAGMNCALRQENLAAALDAGLPLGVADKDSGVSLIEMAITGSGASCLRLLHEKRADLLTTNSVNDETMLRIAARASNFHAFDYLLEDLLKSRDSRKIRDTIFATDRDGDTVLHAVVTSEPYNEDKLLMGLKDDAPVEGAFLRFFLDWCRRAAEGVAPELDLKQLVNVRNRDKVAPLDAVAASYQCPLEKCLLLLEAGADPERTLPHLETLSDLRVVDALLQARADINAKQEGRMKGMQDSCLAKIVRTGDVPLAEAWVRRGADVRLVDANGDTLMAYAQHGDMIRFLQDRGVDLNAQSPATGDTLLHFLVQKGDTMMVQHVLCHLRAKVMPNSRGESLLHIAAKHGHVDTMEFLVQQGFDMGARDREGQTPLHAACQGSRFPAAVYLMDLLADPNSADDMKETPLLETIRAGNVDIFYKLLERKADPLVQTQNHRTLLHVAAGLDRKELMKFLLDQFSKLPVNKATSDELRTALHTAVAREHIAVVEILLSDPRVDVNMEDASGETPAALAAKAGGVRILQTLLDSRPHPEKLLTGPFLKAVEFSQMEVVKYLVETFPSTIDIVAFVDGEYRRNALHLCAFSGDDVLARYLLDQCEGGQAALGKKDSEGQTPRDVSEVRDHDCVARAFNAHLLPKKLQGEEGAASSFRVELQGEEAAASSRMNCNGFCWF